MDDYGLDIGEVTKVINDSDVLVVRFAIVNKRLLVDSRTNDQDGPHIAVVDRAGSIEERFKALKKMRPRFPLPDKIMSFMWPRHIETFRKSGLWDKIQERLVSLGGEPMLERCTKAFEDLAHEERIEVLTAIRGGEGYQSLWERVR
jgi:hypothetical protein